MISSTIEDLRDERQAADEAVRHFQFERFRSETLGSLSRSPEEVCDEMAKECDLYILIIGERYGWVIPQLGISVTEREYNVARDCDGEKILVYVKALEGAVREERETLFMERVTDFRSGYFRSGEFVSATELADKIRNDIAIWISDRLRQKQVSYGDAFSLAHPAELLTSLLSAVLIVLALFLGPSVFRISGSYWQPSLTSIGRALLKYSATILSELFLTWLMVFIAALIAWAFSTSLVFAISSASHKNFGTLLRVVSHLAFAFAIFFFLLGGFSFGFFSKTPLFLILILTAVGWLLLIVRKEVSSTRSQGRSLRPRPIDMSVVMRNVVLARGLPLILPVLFGLSFAYQLSSGLDRGLARLFRYGLDVFMPELLYAVVLASVTTAFIVYFLGSLVQSSIGWSMIIGPALSRSIVRPK